MTFLFKDSEGTLCNGGEWSPHKKWRGIKLPIKVITPPRNLGVLPKPAMYKGYQHFVLPGGDAVYFPHGEKPVYPGLEPQAKRPLSRFEYLQKLDNLSGE